MYLRRYIIINVGLSYQWAYIDPNIKDALPAEMLVDYVRVYQQVGASVGVVGGWLVGGGGVNTRIHTLLMRRRGVELTPACERCPVMISVLYDLEVPVVMHLLLHATHLAPVSCCCVLLQLRSQLPTLLQERMQQCSCHGHRVECRSSERRCCGRCRCCTTVRDLRTLCLSPVPSCCSMAATTQRRCPATRPPCLHASTLPATHGEREMKRMDS